MLRNINPFFYQSASDLKTDQVIQYYAEGGNIARALSSRSNCYLVGERGAGKSMALMYHSFPVQKMIIEKGDIVDTIGIYIPCNHPLMLKNEASLFDKHNELAVSEHFFCLSIAYHLCSSLKECCTLPDATSQKKLLKSLSYSVATQQNIPFSRDIFQSVMNFITRETIIAQSTLNKINTTPLTTTYTFFSLILPLLDIARTILNAKDAHFSLLLDDAHLLSESRRSILNSYISYRDHSQFSFKIAIASCEEYSFKTIQGSTLVSGHDFSLFNMEEDFQSSKSDFGKFIRTIISKRLSDIGIATSPDDYFPISQALAQGIQTGEEEARAEAIAKYGPSATKKINDHVYKYGRARYFKNRNPQAALPQYSGLDTIAHISTGVVRNALYPCWKMFEKEKTKLKGEIPKFISPATQADTLKEESDLLWASIREGFGNKIEGCSKSDSEKIANLFSQLSDLFRDRLHSNCSEPRILVFIVSEKNSPFYGDVKNLLVLCRKAQLLYERFGPGKDDGRRETFYATNRLLWISTGLDPEGQNGRLSLKSSDIHAASLGTPFKFSDSDLEPEIQVSLFSVKD